MSEEENVESDSELDQLKRERDMLHEQREKIRIDNQIVEEACASA